MDADDYLLPSHERQLIEPPSRRERIAQLGFFVAFGALLTGFELTAPEPFLRVLGCWMATACIAALALWALLLRLRSQGGTGNPPWPPLVMVLIVYGAACAMPIGVLSYWSLDYLVEHSGLANDPGVIIGPGAAVVAVLAPVVDLLYRAWALSAARRRRGVELQSAQAQRTDEQLAALALLANQDALTGLPNRRAFERTLERLAGGTQPYAVMFFDFDKFKPINDQYGHATGDAFLQAVAARLKSLLRATDFVARLGGDEFAVLIPGDSAHAIATRLADRFAALMQDPVEAGHASLRSSASIGIAVARPGHTQPEAVVHQADLAMYEAKRAGGARFCVASVEDSAWPVP